MPYCEDCGNTRSFGSSKIPSAVPFTNGAISGVMADFNSGEQLTVISSMGVDKKTVSSAVGRPRKFFDTCLKCGSQNIVWGKDGNS